MLTEANRNTLAETAFKSIKSSLILACIRVYVQSNTRTNRQRLKIID